MFHNNYNPYTSTQNTYIPSSQNRYMPTDIPNNIPNNVSSIPNYHPYTTYTNNIPANQTMTLPNTGTYLKGKLVTSLEEVKGTSADFDGSLNIFPNIGNNRIYTKQINNDGIAIIKTYVLSENDDPVTNVSNINTGDLEMIKARLQSIEDELIYLKNEKSEVIKNEHDSKKSNSKYFK